MADETARVPASRAELGVLAQTLRRPREVVTCVEWMLANGDPVAENLWDEVYRIAMHSRSHRAKLHAIRILADRFDPIPRTPEDPTAGQPRTLAITVINTERGPGTQHAIEGNGGSIRVRNSERERS